jgi:HD superfamily phosphohydrolase YqeK
VVLLGPVGAALLGLVAVVTGQRFFAPVKRVFNGAQFALSGFIAGTVFDLLGGARFHPEQARWVEHVIGPFLGALVTFVLVNLTLMAGVLLLSRQATPRELLHESGQVAVGCLGYGMVGLLIAGLWPRVGPFAAVLTLLPLFIARWAMDQAYAQQQAHAATLAALCQAVETKDFYTRGHSERVSRGSVMIAQEIGMRADRVEAIRYAGMLHDVGKLGVPTKVLQKAGSLTEEEFAAIQLHPMRGLEIVREIGFLDEALAGIMHHHEKMNGRGYPMGLAGDEIPEFARVISVADAFDSMTSTRSYRAARTVGEAVAELRRGMGDHFDPVMVEAFLRAIDREGWEPPRPVVLPDDDVVETTQQDHDDPSAPLRVAGDEARR